MAKLTKEKKVFMTVAQKRDRSLGLVKFTRPLQEKLASCADADSKNLAEVVSEMSSFMAVVRSKSYYGESAEFEKRLNAMAEYLNISIQNCIYNAIKTAV